MIRCFGHERDESLEDNDKAKLFGHLPIEIYLVENWDPEQAADQQRKELVKKFLALGPHGRAVYRRRQIEPTPSQISEILEPFRPARLRTVVGIMERGCWLRTNYSDDETSYDILEAALEAANGGDSNGIILDEKGLFEAPGHAQVEGEGSECWKQLLEVLPEIVTNNDIYKMNDLLAKSQQAWRDADDQDKKGLEWEAQVDAITAMILVEDDLTHAEEDTGTTEATEGEGSGQGSVLQIMLDIYGNVVRSMRQDADEVLWLYHSWKMAVLGGDPCVTDGNVGIEYRPGESCAPPYGDT